MKKMIFGLLLCASVTAHADGPTPEAVKAFKEMASKADNKHWQKQEERLDKAGKQIKANTALQQERLSKNDPKVVESMILQEEDKENKWAAENFGTQQ